MTTYHVLRYDVTDDEVRTVEQEIDQWGFSGWSERIMRHALTGGVDALSSFKQKPWDLGDIHEHAGTYGGWRYSVHRHPDNLYYLLTVYADPGAALRLGDRLWNGTRATAERAEAYNAALAKIAAFETPPENLLNGAHNLIAH